MTRRLTAAQIAGTDRCPPPRVNCAACLGLGHVELPQPYARTYYLTSSGWESTDVQFARHRDGVKRTALINRLNALVALSLVERRGNNRGIQWRRK